jgi:1,4-alpha-glucan branching enzyme
MSPVERITRGYIANDGCEIHPTRGLFKMVPQADGTWVTDAHLPSLGNLAKFDDRPYMFKVPKDDGIVAYRIDLYSRCQIGGGKDNPGGNAHESSIHAVNGTVGCSVADRDWLTKHFCEPVWPEQEWLSQEDFWNEDFTQDRPVPKRVEDPPLTKCALALLASENPVQEPSKTRAS